MVDEIRKINPNPDVDQYRTELDLHKRKFAIDSAIRAQASGMEIQLLEMAKSIYSFLENTSANGATGEP